MRILLPEIYEKIDKPFWAANVTKGLTNGLNLLVWYCTDSIASNNITILCSIIILMKLTHIEVSSVNLSDVTCVLQRL